jgi:hypothetical protein
MGATSCFFLLCYWSILLPLFLVLLVSYDDIAAAVDEKGQRGLFVCMCCKGEGAFLLCFALLAYLFVI